MNINGVSAAIAAYRMSPKRATNAPAMASGPTSAAMLNVGPERPEGFAGGASVPPLAGRTARGGRVSGIVPAGPASRSGSTGTAGSTIDTGTTRSWTAPPSEMTSYGPTSRGPVSRSPFTSVPLRDPRSATTTWPNGLTASPQCSRETAGSSTITSAPARLPTIAVPGPSGTTTPAVRPPITRTRTVPASATRGRLVTGPTVAPTTRPTSRSGASAGRRRPSTHRSPPGRPRAIAKSPTVASGCASLTSRSTMTAPSS
jgi:hypothetical protein